MSDKAVFEKIAPHQYAIPNYTIVEGKGIELVNPPSQATDGVWTVDTSSNLLFNMVRGSKVEGENVLPKLDGVLVEQLIAVAIDHLKAVNTGDLATRETSLAITALEEAGLWLLKRELDRKKANTLGTYQK